MWWALAVVEPDRRPLDAGWPWYFTVVVVGLWLLSVVAIVSIAGRRLARRRERRRGAERLALTTGEDRDDP